MRITFYCEGVIELRSGAIYMLPQLSLSMTSVLTARVPPPLLLTKLLFIDLVIFIIIEGI